MFPCNDHGQDQRFVNPNQVRRHLPPPPTSYAKPPEPRSIETEYDSSYSTFSLDNIRDKGVSIPPSMVPSRSLGYTQHNPSAYPSYIESVKENRTEEEIEDVKRYYDNLYRDDCGDAINETYNMLLERERKIHERLRKMTEQANYSENLLRLHHIGYFPNDIFKPRWNLLNGRLTLASLKSGIHNITKHLLISGDDHKNGETTFGVSNAQTRLKNAVLAEVNVKFFHNHTPVSLAVTICRRSGDTYKPLEPMNSHCFNINERCHFLSHAGSKLKSIENIFRNEPSANHEYANLFPELNSSIESIIKGCSSHGAEWTVPANHVIMKYLAEFLPSKKYIAAGWGWPTKSLDHKGYYLIKKDMFDSVCKEISKFVEENFPVTDLTTLSLHITPTTDIPNTAEDLDDVKNYIDYSIQVLYGLRGGDDVINI